MCIHLPFNWSLNAYIDSTVNIFKKHIGGEAADFRPKAGCCAFSCNHPRPNMADQNCNLGNDLSPKPFPLMSFKSIMADIVYIL